MADTKIKDLAEKATGVASDEFVINDVANGNVDKKMGMDGLRITSSQVTDLAAGAPFTDTTSIVEGSTDATKEIRFEVDGLTTGTVRVITPPDADITLVNTSNGSITNTNLTSGAFGNITGLGTLTTDLLLGGNKFDLSTITLQEVSNVAELTIADNTAGAGIKIQNTDGSFSLTNGTSGADNFLPTFLGVAKGSTRPGLFFVGEIPIISDAGSVALIRFDARRIGPASILTRPLFQITNSGAVKWEMDRDGNVDQKGNNLTNGGVIFLTEQAEADADVAGKGQIWVDTQIPNKLFFTDDAGTDFDITAGGGDTLPIVDTTGIAKGSTDATKIVRFEVDGFTTSTTRVLTPPDADITIAGINLAQTWTTDQTFNDSINLTLGTGGDADIFYNGTDLVINPAVVGSGNLEMAGGLNMRRSLSKVFEHYFTGNSIDVIWTQGNISGSSTFAMTDGIDDGVRITTGASMFNGGFLDFNDFRHFDPVSCIIWGIFSSEDSVNRTQMGVARSGGEVGTSNLEGVAIEHDGRDVNIQLTTGTGSANTITAGTKATDANDVLFKIISDGTSSRLFFLSSGVWTLDVTITTTRPSNPCQPYFSVRTEEAVVHFATAKYIKVQND